MLKYITTILCIICLSVQAHAQSISGYSGTMSDGNSITITGSSFGATGPNIQMYDNFELGTSGANISDGSGDAAVIGEWDWNEGDYNVAYPTYSTNYKVSGSQAMRCNHNNAYDCGTDGTSASIVLTKSTDFYFSYWMYIPSGQVIPGTTSCGPSPNLKVWWLSTNGGYGSDYGLQILSNSDPLDVVALGPIDGGENRCAGSYGLGSCAGEGYVSMPFYRGRWMRMEFYIHGTTDNTGAVYGWVMDSSRTRYAWQSYPTGDNTLDSGDSTGWGYLHLHGYARKDSNSNTYFDDIYVATGPGARARVELGNNATYANCTNLSVFTPTSWSNSSITATVRQGSFSSGTAYLFVIDSNGNASSGHEVTLGEGGGDTTAPTITSVNSDKANGSYKVGEVIDIDVTFSEAVTSTGNVTVTLETGATDRTCTFTVTNSTIGTCNYTVQAGDTSSDLNVNSISGTINDQASPPNAMVNFTPTTNLAANKALVIDTTNPTVTISTSNPSSISSDSLTVTGSVNETASSCRYLIGSAPTSSTGTACASASWSCATSGYARGPNNLYVGCGDAAGNWGSNSIVVNFTPNVNRVTGLTIK